MELGSIPSFSKVGWCNWVYEVKYHFGGSIKRHTTRLVAQCFHQQTGVDYHETISSAVKPATIRLLLSLVVSLEWTIRQLDVKNVSLHGHLTEDVI